MANIQGWVKVGLHEVQLILVLLVNYHFISHLNNSKPTFVHACKYIDSQIYSFLFIKFF